MSNDNFNITEFLGLKPLVEFNVDYQNKAVNKINSGVEDARDHLIFSCFGDVGEIDKGSKSFLPANHPDYIPPSKELVREVVYIIMRRGYTKTNIGEMLGISTVKNRTINNWLSDGKETQIPYCAWLMLSTLAGFTITTMIKEPVLVKT